MYADTETGSCERRDRRASANVSVLCIVIERHRTVTVAPAVKNDPSILQFALDDRKTLTQITSELSSRCFSTMVYFPNDGSAGNVCLPSHLEVEGGHLMSR